MIVFLENYFKDIVLCAGIIYLTLAIILLLFKVPQTEYFERYRTSKRYIAFGFIIISATIFTWLYNFDGNWTKANPLTDSIDLIYYYLIGIVFSYGFSNLLDKHYINKRRVTLDLCKWAVCVTCCIISMQESIHTNIQEFCIFVSFLLFLEFIIQYIYYFRKIYIKNSRMLEDYFTAETVNFVSWIKKSITLIFMSALFAVITINEGAIFNWIFQIYNISINIYITISVINYSAIYAKLKQAEPKDKEEISKQEAMAQRFYANSSEQSKLLLQKKIRIWASTKSYQNNQFTIDELATHLGTNKYYLSRLINEKKHMNFSNWISSLRIADAKEILQAEPNLRLEEVAFRVGFSSPSYFSKVFSNLEGISPSAWVRNLERNSAGELP